MGTIAEKLNYLGDTKTAIKDAIVAKGVQVADDTPFRNYADKIGEISGGGEPVEKTKLGVGIDNFIGDVDADGNYINPEEPFEVNLAGVKKLITSSNFKYKFYNLNGLTRFIADDLVEVHIDSFTNAFENCTKLVFASFNGLESITKSSSFSNAFKGCFEMVVTFNKLKKVSATNVFMNAFYNYSYNTKVEDVFPELQEISGNSAFDSFVDYTWIKNITFPKVKKITGSTGQYSSTFGTFYIKNTVWNFPSATEFTGYIWNVSTSYPGEIHFAAANQAAIEACDGYANKWGFQGASLFFDL